jgi:murein DD-endopeptidase MepM/ murein hydrolase activator NlpD
VRPSPSQLPIDFCNRSGDRLGEASRSSRRQRYLTLLGATALTTFSIGFALMHHPRPVTVAAVAVSRPTHDAAPTPGTPATSPASAGPISPENETLAAANAPIVSGLGFDSIDIIVRRNDTLDRIFRRLELSIADLAAIRALPGIRQALDALRPGEAITLTHRDSELQGLVRKMNETQTLAVTRANSGFAARIIETPVEQKIARKRVVIDSSLFEAANGAGVSDQTALALANIFGWDIDFVLDIRSGDEFTVVYQEIWQEGKYRHAGNILAAEFINNGRTFRAVRYARADGGAEYFTPDGHSMRKAFLRAPVEFTRVSSRFNPNRRHPILNRIRAHKGVDYAAPVGTPVRAAGDGRIEFRGRQGGYGNVVVIEHGGGISTLYGHLSRFAKSVSIGKHVRQGEVIAFVGQTGLATGPHLHYEYRVNGVHRNPQTVPLPDAEPIAPELRADFAARTAPLLAQLDVAKSGQRLAQQ